MRGIRQIGTNFFFSLWANTNKIDTNWLSPTDGGEYDCHFFAGRVAPDSKRR